MDTQFALDPRYMELPGEDYHGFRALAERSVLADEVKDGGMAVASTEPRAALAARSGSATWLADFQRPDFQRLKAQFGVDLVVLKAPRVEGLPCPYQNSAGSGMPGRVTGGTHCHPDP